MLDNQSAQVLVSKLDFHSHANADQYSILSLLSERLSYIHEILLRESLPCLLLFFELSRLIDQVFAGQAFSEYHFHQARDRLGTHRQQLRYTYHGFRQNW